MTKADFVSILTLNPVINSMNNVVFRQVQNTMKPTTIVSLVIIFCAFPPKQVTTLTYQLKGTNTIMFINISIFFLNAISFAIFIHFTSSINCTLHVFSEIVYKFNYQTYTGYVVYFSCSLRHVLYMLMC